MVAKRDNSQFDTPSTGGGFFDAELASRSYSGRSPKLGVSGDKINDELLQRRSTEVNVSATSDDVQPSIDAEFSYGDYRYRLRKTGTIRLVSYKGTSDQPDIPCCIDGVNVTSLASNLFRNHDEMCSVALPDTIEFLGHHVFDGCRNLQSITLSASLNQIPSSTFFKCISLSEVRLGTPVVKFESNSFTDAPIQHLVFGVSVKEIDPSPFLLPSLKSIEVDPGNGNFYSDGKALICKEDKTFYRLVVPAGTYVVPEGCPRIEERAFDSMASLKEVSLPESLLQIGRLAFAKTGLVRIQLPSKLERIEQKAFFHCKELISVEWPRFLKAIEAEAFAYTGVRRVTLPASLEELGFRAFDRTPAQASLSSGDLAISPSNQYMDMDNCGGLYRHDVFVELVGRVGYYEVRRGTHVIGAGAFKRHERIRRVDLPEGVYRIGSEAFLGNRQLERVRLPESLEVIGARAFVDTSLLTLRISRNVRSIEENALLVQGENQLSQHIPLHEIDLDPQNPRFYLQNGMFCEREGNGSYGDSCVVYVGPDKDVRIPDQVTKIDNLAFCGAEGVESLSLHAHMQSICLGAFSTAESIPRVHVDFPRPIDGYECGDFLVPKLSIRYRSPSYLFSTYSAGTFFDFKYYDSWITHTHNINEFAPAGLYRLTHPMRLAERTKDLYRGTFLRKSVAICSYFAQCGNLEALETLHELELLSEDDIEKSLSESTREGRTQATACLFELRHRLGSTENIDFSL